MGRGGSDLDALLAPAPARKWDLQTEWQRALAELRSPSLDLAREAYELAGDDTGRVSQVDEILWEAVLRKCDRSLDHARLTLPPKEFTLRERAVLIPKIREAVTEAHKDPRDKFEGWLGRELTQTSKEISDLTQPRGPDSHIQLGALTLDRARAELSVWINSGGDLGPFAHLILSTQSWDSQIRGAVQSMQRDCVEEFCRKTLTPMICSSLIDRLGLHTGKPALYNEILRPTTQNIPKVAEELGASPRRAHFRREVERLTAFYAARSVASLLPRSEKWISGDWLREPGMGESNRRKDWTEREARGRETAAMYRPDNLRSALSDLRARERFAEALWHDPSGPPDFKAGHRAICGWLREHAIERGGSNG